MNVKAEGINRGDVMVHAVLALRAEEITLSSSKERATIQEFGGRIPPDKWFSVDSQKLKKKMFFVVFASEIKEPIENISVLARAR